MMRDLAPAAQIVAGLNFTPMESVMNAYTHDEVLYARVLALMEAGFSQEEAVRIVAENEAAKCSA